MGRGQEAAETGGGPRAFPAAGPGLQRAGSLEALPDSPAGVPGAGGPDVGAGRGGPAERRSRGVWARARRRGRTTACKRTSSTSARTQGATKVLPDKRAETVTRAAAEIIPNLVQKEGNYGPARKRGAPPEGPQRSECDGGHQSSDPNVEEGFGRRGGPARRRMGGSRRRGNRGLQRPATPGGHGGSEKCRDDAGGHLPRLSR